MLKSLKKSDIHRLNSGQVITSLHSVLKELIENSIDANTSKLEINFVNYGLNSIEIIDNGDGIDESDFDNLCLSHATSKLKEFEDLEKVETLGFRGEALNSLCSISNVSITTNSSNTSKAHVLKFNELGELTDKTIVSRPKGTSVMITNIFNNLPVRQITLQKNIKREFSKALSLITNYIIISKGIKFIVTNTLLSKKKSIIFNSQGVSIKTNLIDLFGSNGNLGLIDVNLDLLIKNYSLIISGLISKPSTGFGRTSNDRQFLYLNNRPITNLKFNKLINEIYKSFNFLQFPYFILNLELKSDKFDLNITPDKQIVLFHDESEILEMIRIKLTEFFDEFDLSITKNFVQRNIDDFAKRSVDEVKNEVKDEPKDAKRRKVDFVETKEAEGSNDEENKAQHEEEVEEDKEDEQLENIKHNQEHIQEEVGEIHEQLEVAQENEDQLNEEELQELEELQGKPVESLFVSENDIEESNNGEDIEEEVAEVSDKENEGSEEEEEDDEEEDEEGDEREEPVRIELYPPRPKRTVERPAIRTNQKKLDLSSFANSTVKRTPLKPQITEPIVIKIGDKEVRHDGYMKNDKLIIEECHHGHHHHHENTGNEEEEEEEEQNDDVEMVSEAPVKDYIGNYSSTIKITNKFTKPLEEKSMTSKEIKIDNIEDSESENLLTLTVSKQDFLKMEVIGQFNLGFIIVIRNDKDLFIIDQHASDEKYNYEDLIKTTVFQSQNLIKPRDLEINSIDETIILENLDIFTQNGFKLSINEENENERSKISLISLPISKRVLFDLNDFNELIHLIKENPLNKSIKVSKIKSMFAMRACRKSIMIGKPLNRKTMVKVVRNLSKLEKPWNCPHGRPTMRHLMELKQWTSFTKDYEI